jgi:hypothetical protein
MAIDNGGGIRSVTNVGGTFIDAEQQYREHCTEAHSPTQTPANALSPLGELARKQPIPLDTSVEAAASADLNKRNITQLLINHELP